MPKLEKSETHDFRGTAIFTNGTVQFADDQIARSKITQNTGASHVIPLDQMRTWDDFSSALPGTAASDDLAIIEGTFGTDAPVIQSSDSQSTTVTQRLRFQFALPENYIAGDTITVRIRGGMNTTISDTSATVDVEAYLHDEDGSVGSDICATSATTINSLTKANQDFTITPTGIDPGDTLDIRVTVAINDSSTGTAVVGEISKISMLLDVR